MRTVKAAITGAFIVGSSLLFWNIRSSLQGDEIVPNVHVGLREAHIALDSQVSKQGGDASTKPENTGLDSKVKFSTQKKSCWNETEFEPVTYRCSKGDTGWTRDMMRAESDEFFKMYSNRPYDNAGGTQMNTQFSIWFTVRQIKPKHIIESGAWRGMGTWLLRQAAPEAQISVVDPRIQDLYIDQREGSRYYTGEAFKDFALIDWVANGVNPAETLVFFDDHQSQPKRLTQAYKLGFRHVMFDDNYFPHKPFDAFSMKEACDAAGCFKAAVGLHTDPVLFYDKFKTVKKFRRKKEIIQIAAEANKAMDIYYELPPLAGVSPPDAQEEGKHTWSSSDKMKLPTDGTYRFVEKPIFTETETVNIISTFQRAIPHMHLAGQNNNVCYIRLKSS